MHWKKWHLRQKTNKNWLFSLSFNVFRNIGVTNGKKERVDILVVQQGLTDSREKQNDLVMAGQIVDAVNHNRYDKPGEKIPMTSSLMIKGEPLKYVSWRLEIRKKP